MCDVLIQVRDKNTIYSGCKFTCSFKSVATATSKYLHTVDGNLAQMRLCKRHATMYEKKHSEHWEVKRD